MTQGSGEGSKSSTGAAMRRVPGRPFKPGRSGNPLGRRPIAPEVKALARQYGAEAIAKLVTLMRHAPDERTQLAAARELLNRGYGRVPFSVEHSGAPLVAVNVGIQANGERITAEMAYRAMLEGGIAPDPAHPAFRPILAAPETATSANPDPDLYAVEETQGDSKP
jgi:hypothetical protein